MLDGPAHPRYERCAQRESPMVDQFDMSSGDDDGPILRAVNRNYGHLQQILHEVRDLERKVTKMTIDIKHLSDSEQRLVGVVEQVLVLVGNQQAALKTLSDQLAAAIAANDPVGNAALQSQIDGMAKTLDEEVVKVGNSLAAASALAGPSASVQTSAQTPETGPVSTSTPSPTSAGSIGVAPTGSTASSPVDAGPLPPVPGAAA